MKRIAIVLEKNIEIGAAANVAALLMGQVTLVDPTVYADTPVLDKNDIQHSGIKYSTVVLKAGENQLNTLALKIADSEPNLQCVVFSKIGQGLNNEFEQYLVEINSKTTQEISLAGLAVWGEYDKVRELTKKYSVM